MKNFKNILYVIEFIFVFITTILGSAFLIAVFVASLNLRDCRGLIFFICSVIACNRLLSILKKLM